MRVSDFHFDLPEELIAQHPPAERGSSRMLVLDRGTGAVTDTMFADLPGLLEPGDLLVLNDSRVLPARLFATRAGLGTQAGSPRPSGTVEVLLVEEVERQGKENAGILRSAQNDTSGGHPVLWRVLVRPAKKVRVGETLLFFEAGEGGEQPVLTAEVVEAGEFGERTLRFAAVEDFYGVVGRIGHMPLPPYIKRERGDARAREASDNVDAARTVVPQGLKPRWFPGGDGTAEAVPLTKQWGSSGLAGETVAEGFEAEDRERYQTVYAQTLGSVAAPTAGLHFTPEVLAALEARGVEIATVTLHVGLGTFQPVRVAEVEDIRLHSERYTLPAATADALNRAIAEGRRVVAVGTTTTRTLEHIAERMALRVEGHVPGAKALVDSVPVMPGLKSRPISELAGSGPISGLAGSGPISGLAGSGPISGLAESWPISGLAESGPISGLAGSGPISELAGSGPISGLAGSGPISGLAESRPISEANSFAADGPVRFEAHSGATSIFIGPGHRFRVVGGLLTNFHLPESTLLMLVAAFAGDRAKVLAAYEHAVRERYRFYSYGDCMLVL